METMIMKEIMKKCKWYEKIIIKIFKKIFIKVYHISRLNTMNAIFEIHSKVIKYKN